MCKWCVIFKNMAIWLDWISCRRHHKQCTNNINYNRGAILESDARKVVTTIFTYMLLLSRRLIQESLHSFYNCFLKNVIPFTVNYQNDDINNVNIFVVFSFVIVIIIQIYIYIYIYYTNYPNTNYYTRLLYYSHYKTY